MKCVVLAAKHERGKDSSGREVPRPLLDLGAEPMLTRLVRQLSAIEGMGRITIVVNEAFRPEFEQWAKTLTEGRAKVGVLSDGTRSPDESIGAMGDLLFAMKKRRIKNEELLVVGGDNWFTYDLAKFIERAREHRHPAVVVTPLQPGWRTRRFGLVETDSNGHMIQFVEKPEHSALRLKASCLYYFAPENLEWVRKFKEEGNDTNCPPGKFFAWLVNEKHEDVLAVEMKGEWHDISSPRPLTGPALLDLRDIVRRMVSEKHSTWERDAAKSLQWVNSWEDVIEMMDHDQPNNRILAADLAGRIGSMVDQDAQDALVRKLLMHLNDDKQNEYQYGRFQSDEESSVLVSEAAADSLAKLGYAKTRADVFTRARQERVIE
jgi:NDP-sugar pyrophosphorylase family protein